MAYLRFVCGARVEGMAARAGLLAAAYDLRRSESVDSATEQALTTLIDWFKANLTVPKRFGRTNSEGWYRRDTKGLSWFKPEAGDHIAKAFELVVVLNGAGVKVEVLKSDRIGYVVYEDDHQIIAEPFADTPV